VVVGPPPQPWLVLGAEWEQAGRGRGQGRGRGPEQPPGPQQAPEPGVPILLTPEH
jgi:hypothetical protein